MQRIEPTIGEVELSADPVAIASIKAAAKSRRLRKAILDWLVIAFLFVVTVALCGVLAASAGLVPEQFKLGTPQLFERSLIILGLAVVFLAQLVGSILVFRFSFAQGGLSLLIPGYLFFALRRNGLYASVIGTLCIGLLAVVVGTALLT